MKTMTLERGAFLYNRYRILEILGQGGMGSIYRAIDENLGVEVAVKENLFTTEEYARQFRREAIILANLRHPNLPRVSDHFVIEAQGQYLVMDYIEGEDLRERMDRLGVIHENEIIVIGAAICDALTYMHSRKPPVLHRDLKPGNVKITPQGEIFLVDFGLAKVVQAGEQTTTGARAMTPGYSPPEQYGAARTDHRSDIYSLGATLYAALVGVIPEDSLARTMEQTELTPLRKRNANISRRTANTLEKALEVHPDDRFQTAEEFKQALLTERSNTVRRMVEKGVLPPRTLSERFNYTLDQTTESPVKVDSAPPVESSPYPFPVSTSLDEVINEQVGQKRKPFWRSCFLTIAFLLIIAVIGFGAAYLLRPNLFLHSINQGSTQLVGMVPELATPISRFLRSSSNQPEPTETQNLQEVVITTDAPIPTKTALPTIANTITPMEPTLEDSTPSPTAIPTQTPAPTNTTMPSPTPLGGGFGQIAFASDRTGQPQIWMINIDGSGLKQITDAQWGACQPDWSPDGSRLVYVSPCDGNKEYYRGSGLFIINADGTDPVSLPVQGFGDYDPAWSPDGKKIAFTSIMPVDRPKILVMDLESGEIQNLSMEFNRDIQPEWTSDGDQIIFVTTREGPYQIWTMSPDGSNQTRFSLSGELKNTNPVVSPGDSTLIFTQSRGEGSVPHLRGAIFPDGAKEEFDVYPFSGILPARDANFSPDGFWIVFESWPNGVLHDIYYMAPNGAEFTRLTTDPALDFDPIWRPFSLDD
jgi:serine/threonine protein kinase